MAKAKRMATKTPTNKLSLGLKCGDCLHFKAGPKSPLYPSRCSELGTKNYAKAPPCFTPNFTALNRRDGSLSAAAKIAKVCSMLNASNMRIVAYLLAKQGTQFEKINVKFGQPMYVFLEPTIGLARAGLDQLKGENFHYLENYYKAYVAGITDLEDGVRQLYLASTMEGKPDFYFSVNQKEGEKFKKALTQDEFDKMKERLIKEDRKRMPKDMRKRLEKLHELKLAPPADEEVRTIDDVPAGWWTNSVHNGEEKKARRNRGVSLVSKRKKHKASSVDADLKGGLKIKRTKKPVKVLKSKKKGTTTKIRLTSK